MSGSDNKILVWDLPTRLFHWVIVALVASAYVTWRLNWMDWHIRAGYAVLAAVLFRILWGFLGSDTARFSRFVAAPRAAASHLAQALRRDPDRQVGHNPAGGWMVLLFLLLLLAESLTGLYVNNDVADEGPFTELAPASVANAISALHWILWNALLAAIALHVLAILAYASVKRHNLVTPMITGRKSLPVSVQAPHMTGALRALLLLGGSSLVAAALAHFL